MPSYVKSSPFNSEQPPLHGDVAGMVGYIYSTDSVTEQEILVRLLDTAVATRQSRAQPVEQNNDVGNLTHLGSLEVVDAQLQRPSPMTAKDTKDTKTVE